MIISFHAYFASEHPLRSFRIIRYTNIVRRYIFLATPIYLLVQQK
jgi:hypothetical protein